MKKILLAIMLLCCFYSSFSQSWDQSGSCQVNVNDPSYLNLLAGRQGIISATVKLGIDGECSGTLVNRNTSNSDVGFYILTAKHCVDGLDFNVTHTVYFNYQSPDANDNSTPTSNRGISDFQSWRLTDNGYEYRHQTLLRLVGDFTWGDMALVEILTPVPVHFNVTYAGWNPSRFYSTDLPPILPSPLVAIHHPRGDIKKISGINKVYWLETPIATGCYTITTIIDVLFGWIWGNRVSTSVICNYVDNPWLSVPIYQYGVVENGSSGSGIFNPSNQVFGVLSGGLGTCDIPVLEFYGKLHANYSNKSIKNALNPNNNVWVDLLGMGERKITQYDNLVLPGSNGVSGNYFPANHYQSNNKIVLLANNNISTTQPLTIFTGAEYEFVAGNSITLGPGFSAQSGSTFTAKIGNSSSLKSGVSSMEQDMIGRLKTIQLPKSKTFNIDKYLHENELLEQLQISEVYPNPNEGNFSFEILSNIKCKLKIELVNIHGQSFHNDVLTVDNSFTVNLNVQNIQKGLYILKITGDKTLINRKIIIK